MAIQSINPFNNKLSATFAETAPEQVAIDIELADQTFRVWRNTAYIHRAALLQSLAGRIRKERDRLAKLITLETGQLLGQSFGEIDLCADILDYYAENTEIFHSSVSMSSDFVEAYIEFSPIGVLLGIEPCSFPFYQAIRFAAPNIMAGNVVLIKPASNVPLCALAIQELFEQSGTTRGLYTNLLISSDSALRILEDPRIKGVALSARDTVASSIASAAGKHLKKSAIGLGESDTLIILEDADISMAVKWILVGKMSNTKRCCATSKRILVLESIASKVLEKLKQAMSGLTIGDPMDAATELGPVNSEGALMDLIEQIQRSVRAGAKVLLGGKLIAGPGAFIEATILGEVKPGMPAYEEYLNGPVFCFYKAKDEKEIIELVGNLPFGVSTSIFTTDLEHGKRLAEKIHTGMVLINHSAWTQPGEPFGGRNGSGYGKELFNSGIQEFVNKKLIRINKPANS